MSPLTAQYLDGPLAGTQEQVPPAVVLSVPVPRPFLEAGPLGQYRYLFRWCSGRIAYYSYAGTMAAAG